MDVNEIRDAVNKGVTPPKSGVMTITRELSNEIAKVCPFWSPVIRDRDLQNSEGGDEYVSGLIETFSRIYTVLKERSLEAILNPLGLNTVYGLDKMLNEGDLGLFDEYPALELAGVREMGSFGGGILMAFALLETALSLTEGKVGREPLPEKSDHRKIAGPPDPEAVSLVDEILGKSVPSDEPDHSEKTRANFREKPDVMKLSHQELRKEAPIMLLGIFPSANGIIVKGELPRTLSGMAQSYNIVKAIFGVDATVSMGEHGLEFRIAYGQQETE